QGNRSHTIREMRHGTKEEFEYFECAGCGSMQIREIPEDLSKYYPDFYYSFKARKNRIGDVFKQFVRRERGKHSLGGKSAWGRLFKMIYGEPNSFNWFRTAGLDFDSKVLDVGCGSGGVLLKMQMDGFRDLTGADPYVSEALERDERIKIRKCEVFEIDEPFDFILLNHSFEHMPDPLATLKHLFKILNPNRKVLIRTPVASCHAWEVYGTDWVQLDAPRHLHIFSEKGMGILAERAGFVLDKVVYDSRSVQFWGSDQFQKDIALVAEDSHGENPSKSIFTLEQIEHYKAKSEELNRLGTGDQAQFYLLKPD
ncbi:MAG: class I SAM-dependent methyltransferase, partial [Planctomycetota bacterium]